MIGVGIRLIKMAMNSGRTGKVSDAEIISAFQDSEDAFLTAAEVAEKFDITQQAAHSRLAGLHERGVLHRKKAGARAVGWWLSDDYSAS
jgi:Fic family protein